MKSSHHKQSKVTAAFIYFNNLRTLGAYFCECITEHIFDNDQFCDSHIIFFYHTQQKPSFSSIVFNICAPCTMPPCLLRQCGTYEMLFAMAFLCPVSPRESDRCSHRTWKPLVMHVSLDHPWWWPEVRRPIPLTWELLSFSTFLIDS